MVSDFAKTMRNWRRMCNAFVKQYDNDCCKYCPLDHYKSCGAIWEIEEGTYGNIAETVDSWASENPEPQYPTWAEWFLETNQVGRERHMNDWHSLLHSPIPSDIAEKLGIEPKGGENDV